MGSQENLLRRSFVPGEILTFWADAADSVGVSIFLAFGDLRLWMKNMVLVPEMRSFLGWCFPTPLGRSLLHSLALERDQISASGP